MHGFKATAEMVSGYVTCLPLHSFCTVIPTYSSTNSTSSHSFPQLVLNVKQWAVWLFKHSIYFPSNLRLFYNYFVVDYFHLPSVIVTCRLLFGSSWLIICTNIYCLILWWDILLWCIHVTDEHKDSHPQLCPLQSSVMVLLFGCYMCCSYIWLLAFGSASVRMTYVASRCLESHSFII
jgi:hypothetical protein